MSDTRRNPYLLVVGCARSGTTLLQRMLDSHPELAVANDSHFITEPIEHVPIGEDPALAPDHVTWVRTYRRIHRLGLPDAAFDVAAAGASTYGEFVAGVYGEYARMRGKQIAGEKTAGFVRELPRLHGLFPWLRTIHIIRDGRDVALSTLDWAKDGKGPSKLELWQTEPVAVCALWWRRNVRAGRTDGAGLGAAHYRQVFYEALVDAAPERLRELAGFLGLPDAPEMAAYHIGRTVYSSGLTSKKAWLPPTRGLRDWRADMGERDVALFEALAGDLLDALGYERRTREVPAEIADVAERCRVWWEAKMAKRQAGQR